MLFRKCTLKIYQQSDGKKPFDIWINALKDKMSQARIRARLDKVTIGNLGDFKSVGDGVCELRFSFGPGFRIYFAFDKEDIILLLLGGDKSSQDKDIKKAKEYWIDYLKRSHE